MVNEFLWWWLDNEMNPTLLTGEVIERWLGARWSKEELIERQSFLAQELVELFRRMDIKAIQPFVYLSNNHGPTGNWFAGDIAHLRPKPVLDALRNAFAPFGVSIELWDRHFFTDERRTIRIFIFNDGEESESGTVRAGICGEDGAWLTRTEERVHVPAGERQVKSVEVGFPPEAGDYTVTAELVTADDGVIAVSRKRAHVLRQPQASPLLSTMRIALFDPRGEIASYLASVGVATENVRTAGLERAGVLLVGEGSIRDPFFQSMSDRLSRFVQSGGTVIVIEPELGVTERELVAAPAGIALTIEPRNDVDRGGYDSYVFAEHPAHPLWEGIPKKHLLMFNGGYGGEVVSEHDVSANISATVHARCGMRLKTAAVFELQSGSGRILVSRLQLRGRLVGSNGNDALYQRRPDPVLQRYLLNLLSYAGQKHSHPD
jgi:hypothetical protein